jgi:hypothetical protein
MNRVPTVWVEAPDEDDPDDVSHSLLFRLRNEWTAVDRDQLVLPVTVVGRDGEDLDEPRPAILMQYGGESLLNQMLLEADGTPETGSLWVLDHSEGFGRTIETIPED